MQIFSIAFFKFNKSYCFIDTNKVFWKVQHTFEFWWCIELAYNNTKHIYIYIYILKLREDSYRVTIATDWLIASK